ncbi:MAG: TetM/TetW/TetO/TetS family tetracycline resistance ribosomal protection protein [Lachnospiraceae bacterium]|nr:TetM/TetW/TetO/TetS family tetracycline resistance ribosomal protection protein [Lachnospiraceae bacterium]
MDRKKLVLGILAHVDAGKTTLAESMLYLSGSIRKAGRVDHGDAFLDTDSQERERGITIFSKQAEFSWEEMDVTLLDTPGHVDFGAEMERTLQVLDYAILVISGADGVQGHVMTLWKLLNRYQIPVFLFVNKMDQPGTDKERLLQELQERLSGQCIDFSKEQDESFAENVAVCDEKLLEKYLENGSIGTEEIAELVAQRKVFPCFFGSALKIEGVEELLSGVCRYSLARRYPDAFAARVFKIARDAQGDRLTYLKITGGSLKVKQILTKEAEAGKEGWEEKVDQIRVYSGTKYEAIQEAAAGVVCAVTGLSKTYSGEGLGAEEENEAPLLAPVMTYRILLPEECDLHVMYKKLCQLEEEEPQLHIVWKEQLGEIHAQLMGEVQIEILKKLIEERFGVSVEFDEGSIVYRETIRTAVEGVGHFEPLRHYAEVHLLLEPGEPGSGLVFGADCSEDVLDKNWQRLILTHLEEKEHIGVLTGSPITDMKIALVAGRAHLKHTEGGDFRQATYRAVRQGLSKAESILLEPVYEFRLELPSSMIGRAMSDIQAMHGSFEPPVIEGEMSILTGTAPVATMQGYQKELIAYSGGCGRMFCSLKGYEPCHNTEEVIDKIGYDAERDLDNPASSVFCAHGAGFVVNWYDVENYMHVESPLQKHFADDGANEWRVQGIERSQQNTEKLRNAGKSGRQEDKELEEIFKRTYGTVERVKPGYQKTIRAKQNEYISSGKAKPLTEDQKKEYLLVDGYNIIFAWEELKELAKVNLDSARGKLMDILSNYQGYRKMTLILVFDAYKVKGNPGSVSMYHNIHVVYTKEAETADQYIEKVTHEIGRKYRVTVATSDGLEQLIIMGQGAARISARELKEEIMSTNQEMREVFLEKPVQGKQYLFDELSDELAEHMEEVRLGKKEF